jgi:hypothetical protein
MTCADFAPVQQQQLAVLRSCRTKEALSEAQQAATDLGTGVSGPNAAKVVEGAAEGTDVGAPCHTLLCHRPALVCCCSHLHLANPLP